MRVLVVGSGAREHALAWGLARSPSVREVWSAPGNPGMGALGPRRAVAADDVGGLVDLALEARVDLVVVGPEAPLALGLADRLRESGLSCFGPSAAAARLESSKAFAKTVMARAGVATAPFSVASSVEEALAAVRELGLPAVLKADGLAAGKGVRVCHDLEEARGFAWACLEERAFGDAGRRLVVESFLEGEEVSLFALVGGGEALLLPAARDYKRLGTGDTGPNTGGMGAYAPADQPAGESEAVRRGVIEPVLATLAADGTPYAGLLYCGIMRTAQGPMVLEFNCRFGDPETQVLIPLLGSDLGRLLAASAGSDVAAPPTWRAGACVGVVLAAAGYPERPRSGDPIAGLEEASRVPGVQVFQAGTEERGSTLVAAGGRVLTVTAVAETRERARARAYEALSTIRLEGAQWRADVAAQAAGAGAGREAPWQ